MVTADLFRWAWAGVPCQIETWCGRTTEHYHTPDGQLYESVDEFEGVWAELIGNYTISTPGLPSANLPRFRAARDADGGDLLQLVVPLDGQPEQDFLLGRQMALYFEPARDNIFIVQGDLVRDPREEELIKVTGRTNRNGGQIFLSRGAKGLVDRRFSLIGEWYVE